MGIQFGNAALRVLLGALAGLTSYGILLSTSGPWEEALPAALIGAAGCAVLGERRAILLGAVACAGGWIAGAVLFGVVVELGLGAWMVAAGALGAALGLYVGSWRRALGGALLGVLCGLGIEVTRFLPLLLKGLRYVDMQLLALLGAGASMPLLVSLILGRRRRRWPGILGA